MLAYVICSRSACTHRPQPLTKFRSPSRKRSLCVRSPTTDPGTVERFYDFYQKLSFRNLKVQEYNWFSGLCGKQTEIKERYSNVYVFSKQDTSGIIRWIIVYRHNLRVRASYWTSFVITPTRGVKEAYGV